MKKFYHYINLLSVILFIASIALPIIFWKQIPDTIPTHYNAAGIPDAYSDKSTLILVYVAEVFVLGGMFLAMAFVKMTSSSQNATEAEKLSIHFIYPMLSILNFVMIAMFSYMLYCSATCNPLGILFVPVVLIFSFAPIVYFLFQYYKKTEGRFKESNNYLKEREKKAAEYSYRTKVDWWLGGILIFACVLPIWISIAELLEDGRITVWILLMNVFMLVLIVPMFFMKYELYETHLRIQCGLFGSQRIPYKSITSIKKTSNPLSSAAMSLKRIQIDYVMEGTHGYTLISPVRRKEFMELLKEKCNLDT